jgi:hypothetical protein
MCGTHSGWDRRYATCTLAKIWICQISLNCSIRIEVLPWKQINSSHSRNIQFSCIEFILDVVLTRYFSIKITQFNVFSTNSQSFFSFLEFEMQGKSIRGLHVCYFPLWWYSNYKCALFCFQNKSVAIGLFSLFHSGGVFNFRAMNSS